MHRVRTVVFLAAVLTTASASGQMIGINVVLNAPPDANAFAQLRALGKVLDVIPEINGITMKAQADSLCTIQALPFVAAANPDVEWQLAGASSFVPVSDFCAGGNLWNLDAINVTDYGTTRSVPYDGDGVYVAVVDSGLPSNWRDYFPEDRIAAEFGVAFGGGGGEVVHVATQPEKWQHDTNGHGTGVTSILLGFSYLGTQSFNGVAPRATVIPIKVIKENGDTTFSSVTTRAILYVAGLKTSGALGNAPVVINLSLGSLIPDAMKRAAIDYAIAQGIAVVACAGNEGAGGMIYPGAWPEVISVGAAGSVHQFPSSNPLWWTLDDVHEADALEYYLAGFSSRELPGQDLDVAAPTLVPVAYTRAGQPDYRFFSGTSAACPHVAGVVALMLQKNPNLTQAQIEAILEGTTMPLAPGCRAIAGVAIGPGNEPTFSDFSNVSFFGTTVCWDVDATGHGLVQADAALSATPLP